MSKTTKTRRAKAPGKTASKPHGPAGERMLTNGTSTSKPMTKKVGRPKGSKNIRSRALRQALQTADMSPLDYMLSIMGDPAQDQEDRLDAAKAAAPYCHARLASITVQERPYDGDPNTITTEFLASIVASYGSSDDDAAAPGPGKTH